MNSQNKIRRTKLRLFAIAAFSFGISLTCRADLYVSPAGSDSNSGTQASPFKTISKAASLITPGNTVHVAPGTYIGGFKTTKSGTASARIRYISDTKWGAKIVPTATSDYVWQNTGAYTDIIGFEITAEGITTQERLGIYLRGGNSSVKNCHVHHIANKIACDQSGGAALVADGALGAAIMDYEFTGNLVRNIGLNTPCNFIQGIYLSTRGIIKNNLIYKAGRNGIQLWHDADHITVANNTIFSCETGILVGTGDWYFRTTPGDYNNIHNNICIDNLYGIRESSGGEHGVNNYYVNNLVFRNATNNISTFSENTSHVSGSITKDPLFVNYIATGGGDYRLKSTSPAIDIGSSNYAPLTDFDGNTRPQGAGFDIGAYEYTLTTEAENIFMEEQSLILYPNPFHTNFTVKIPSEIIIKDAMMKIYNVCGKEERAFLINDHQTTIDRDNLKNGIYFYLLINNKENIRMGELVIQ